jgi:hypothetical protein
MPQKMEGGENCGRDRSTSMAKWLSTLGGDSGGRGVGVILAANQNMGCCPVCMCGWVGTTPLPLRKHAERQENDSQTGSCA